MIIDEMNIIEKMYNIAINLIEGMAEIWRWLNSSLEIGFNLPIIGYVGIESFVPIDVIGIGLLAFVLLWLVKALVPIL